MKAIELMGTVDDRGNLSLDALVLISANSRPQFTSEKYSFRNHLRSYWTDDRPNPKTSIEPNLKIN